MAFCSIFYFQFIRVFTSWVSLTKFHSLCFYRDQSEWQCYWKFVLQKLLCFFNSFWVSSVSLLSSSASNTKSIFIILCYITNFSWEDVTHPFCSPLSLIPYTEASKFQCAYTIKIQFGDTINFIGIIYRIMDEGLLTRAETAERQVHDETTCQLGDSSQKLEVWSTLQNLNRFGVLVTVDSVGWYF